MTALEVAALLVANGWLPVEQGEPRGPWRRRPEHTCGCGSLAFWKDGLGLWRCATCKPAPVRQHRAAAWLVLCGEWEPVVIRRGNGRKKAA